jgi:broad specificity phosphatase PhoE
MRITLVRHGQSVANLGDWDYEENGDHEVCLTPKGQRQAEEVGSKLKPLLLKAREGKALVYTSPYERTRETLDFLIKGADIPREELRSFEDARLREVDHGYEAIPPQEPLRKIHGWFYYRFKGGESPADCFDRTSTFLESMMRQVARKSPEEVLIVTHGLSIRCFIMRFMHLSVKQFEDLANPDNCAIITIDHKEKIENPNFVSGRWAVSGLHFRK